MHRNVAIQTAQATVVDFDRAPNEKGVYSEIHPSDDQSHGDGFQQSVTLASVIENSTILGYVSETIGTGTPGSGRDAGNDYDQNYIVTQAQMEAWREELCNYWTDPTQSKYGVAHRLPSGGSVAAVMVNRENLTIRHSYFGGGFATINIMDSALPTDMNVTIEDSTFWNDMKNGHSSGNPADKGDAILIRAGKNVNLSGNVWSDGTPVQPTYA